MATRTTTEVDLDRYWSKGSTSGRGFRKVKTEGLLEGISFMQKKSHAKSQRCKVANELLICGNRLLSVFFFVSFRHNRTTAFLIQGKGKNEGICLAEWRRPLVEGPPWACPMGELVSQANAMCGSRSPPSPPPSAAEREEGFGVPCRS